MDKLPPAMTYNRPPTLQQRAPDPGRFRSIDVLPDNAQQDPEYQRMVRDIESLQQRQGWLAGRGAFDKEDLLYLRDREQQQRLTEQEQRDLEATEYAAARARIELQEQEAASASLRVAAAAAAKSKPHSKAVAPLVKVRPQHCKEKPQHLAAGQQAQNHAVPDLQEQGREPKRQKLDSSSNTAAKPPDQPLSDDAAAAAACSSRAAAFQPATSGTCRAGSAGGDAVRSQLKSNGCASTGRHQLPQNAERSGAAVAGLKGLLGVYGSESESEDTGSVGADRSQEVNGMQEQPKLPSAAELLEQELHSSFAPVQNEPAHHQPDSPPASSSRFPSGPTAMYQQHSHWI